MASDFAASRSSLLGMIRSEESGWMIIATASLGFRPTSLTHVFGRETTKLFPPVIWTLRKSISLSALYATI